MSRILDFRSAASSVLITQDDRSNAPVPQSAVVKSALCVLFLLAFMPGALAQFSSGFTGVVVDQTSAAVGGAKIIVTNQDTHVIRSSVSASAGDFRVPSLPGGTYSIEVQAGGFKSWIQKDVLLENNQVKTDRKSVV